MARAIGTRLNAAQTLGAADDPLTIAAAGAALSTTTDPGVLAPPLATPWLISTDGTIASAGPYGLALFSAGTVNNGPDAGAALIAGAIAGIVASDPATTVVNDATIDGAGLAAIWLEAGGAVTNRATLAGGVSAVFAAGPVTIDNHGAMSGAGGFGAIVLQGGGVTNGGTITGAIAGIGDFGGVGGLTNTGTIIGQNAFGAIYVAGATIANTGMLSGLWSGAYVTGGAVAVSNSGSIAGGGLAGLWIDGTGDVANGGDAATTATISGQTSGVFWTRFPASLANFGTISATAGFGALLVEGGALANGDAATPRALVTGPIDGVAAFAGALALANMGRISGAAAFGVIAAAGGTLANGFSGTILGGSVGVALFGPPGVVANVGAVTGTTGAGLWLASGGTVENSGTVTGGGPGLLLQGAGGTITNSGTILGAVGVQASGESTGAAAVVINAGLIAGTVGTALRFSDPGATLEVSPGASFTGAVLGAGDSTLELSAPGASVGGLGTQFSGFGTVLVQAGGTWLLKGSNTIGSADTLALDGVLALSAGASLDIEGAVSGGGVIDLGGAGAQVLTLGAAARASVALGDVGAGDSIVLSGVDATGDTTATVSANPGGTDVVTVRDTTGGVIATLTAVTLAASGLGFTDAISENTLTLVATPLQAPPPTAPSGSTVSKAGVAPSGTTTSTSGTATPAPPLSLTSLSPANGTSVIALSVEPDVIFSRAVDPSTVTPDSFYATDPSGTVIPASVTVAGDGESAALLFAAQFTGTTAITLHLIGGLIADAADTTALDAADSGIAGSTLAATFTLDAFSAAWTASGGGPWGNAENWSNGLDPDAADSVLIALRDGATVTHNGGSDSILSLSMRGAGTLAVSGGALSVAATIDLGGGVLAIDNGATVGATQLSGGKIDMGGGAILEYAAGGTLAIGPNTIVAQTTGVAAIGTPTTPGTGNFIDDGLMTLAGGFVGVAGENFFNGGTIVLGFGEILDDQQNGTLSNAGLISVGPGAMFSEVAKSFGNTGSISVAAGGTVNLGGVLTLAALGAITGAGLLQISGTLDLGGGTFDVTGAANPAHVAITGTIEDGSMIVDGGTLDLSGALLRNIIFDQSFSTGGARMSVAGGLTVRPSGSAGGGTIDMRLGGTLDILDSETLDTVTIMLGAGATVLAALQNGTLTLGGGATISQTTGTASLASYYIDGGTIINRGQMSLAGGTFDEDFSRVFINAGTIALGDGENFVTDNLGTLANTGLIVLGASATLSSAATAFANTGSIDILAGGTLVLGGSLGIAALGAIGNAGVLRITGLLDAGGGTLDLKGGTALADLALSGTIADATILLDGGTLSLDNATFDSVAVTGVLALGPDQILRVGGGLSVGSAGIGAAGTIDLRQGGALTFLDTETLNAQTILVGGGARIAQGAPNTALTLGPATTVFGTSGALALSASYFGATLVNLGTINLANGSLATEAAGAIANAGLIALGYGESWTANDAVTLTNTGSIAIGAGASVRAATLVFDNTGSISIAAGGTLDLGGPVQLAALGAIGNAGLLMFSGTLDLGGGTLDAAPGGAFANVAISGTVRNGTLAVRGGTVALKGATLTGLTIFPAVAASTGTVSIVGGISIRASAGGGAGTLDARGGKIRIEDSETLDAMTILLGGSGGLLDTASLGTLTLGGAATVTQTYGGAAISAAGAIINRGTMRLSGGAFSANSAGVFDNAGLIALGFGENFATPAATLSNSGTIAVARGATLDMTAARLSNTGAITVAAGGLILVGSGTSENALGAIIFSGGGTLEMGENLALGALSGVTGGGTLVVEAGVTLDLGGGTLDLAGNSPFDLLTLDGTIRNGTPEFGSGGGLLVGGAASLIGVTEIGANGASTPETLSGSNDLAGGTLDIRQGTSLGNLTLAGTVSNGALLLEGGVLSFAADASLVAMTVIGAFAPVGTMAVTGGLTVRASRSATYGTIDLRGGGFLAVTDNEAWDNVALLIGGGGLVLTAAGGTLTLGPNAVTTQTTGSATIQASGGGEIVNRGAMVLSGGGFSSSAGIANAGTITLGANAVLAVSGSGGFANSGLLAVGSGAIVRTGTGAFSNTGGITIAGGATLDLGGALGLASLGALGGTGLLRIGGALSLGGGTLDIKPGTAFGNVALAGTVSGGSIMLDGGSVAFASGAMLDSMTVIGTLAPVATIAVAGGLTARASVNGGRGTVDLRGGASLSFEDSETLDTLAILLGGTLSLGAAALSLTLGANAAVTQMSGNAAVTGGGTGDSFVNRGTISLSGGTFTDQLLNGSLSNAGMLALGPGETFNTIFSGTLVNTGVLTIAAGAVLHTGVGSFVDTGAVTIAAGGLLDLGGAVSLGSLGDIGGAGVLNISGTMVLGGGTLDIRAGGAFGDMSVTGTLTGGTVLLDGGIFAFGGATFARMTVIGTLAPDTALTVLGGLTVRSEANAAAGTIDLRSGATMTIGDTETLDNLALLLGGGLMLGAVSTGLTLGADVTTTQSTGTAAIASGNADASFVNRGAMRLAGGVFEDELGAGIFKNTGAIALGVGAVFGAPASGTLVNNGVIQIAAGASLLAGGAFSNTGTISIAAGGTLALGGTLAPAALGAIGGDGLVKFDGTLSLGGGTLDIRPGASTGNVLLSGAARNGTLLLDEGAFAVATGATLIGMTVIGTLAPTVDVSVTGGLTVRSSAGAASGTIDLRNGGALTVADGETWDHATVMLAANSGILLNGPTASLTLGASEIVTQTTGNATIGGSGSTGSFVNNGTMNLSGGNLSENLSGGGFTNAGVIALGTDEILSIGPARFDNTGTIALGSGATLDLFGTVALAALGAISGSGEVLVSGTFDLGGATIDVAAGSPYGALVVSGILRNGTVIDDGGAVTFSGAGQESNIATMIATVGATPHSPGL